MKCFDFKFVLKRLSDVSNRFIEQNWHKKEEIKLYTPQKQCVLKAKVDSCFVGSLHWKAKPKRVDHIESLPKEKHPAWENASTCHT